ncbi:phage tail terminator-like protein [Pelagibius sp.]|uniref:phage tail terminator-like protein n=1 Tax=Pelagibius sp. TaxID=1931238 RepID=UPI003BB163BE
MASVEVNIWMALRGRLETLSVIPAAPVVYPKEDAPAGRYLRVQHLPNRLSRFAVGSDGSNERPGILQVSVMSPIETQETAEVDMEVAGQVAAHFPADLMLEFGGLQVRITRAPDVAGAYRDEAHWRTPVSIPYEALI